MIYMAIYCECRKNKLKGGVKMREMDRDVLELVYALAAELVRLRRELDNTVADRNMWKYMYFDIAKKAEGKQE